MSPKQTRTGEGSRHIIKMDGDIVIASKAAAERQNKSWYLWLEEAVKEKLERSAEQ